MFALRVEHAPFEKHSELSIERYYPDRIHEHVHMNRHNALHHKPSVDEGSILHAMPCPPPGYANDTPPQAQAPPQRKGKT